MKIFNLSGKSQEERNVIMNEMTDYLEKVLVSQCVEQHFEMDSTVLHKGRVTSYEIHHEENDDYMLLRYENGEEWEYRDIDYGADGMEYKRVK